MRLFKKNNLKVLTENPIQLHNTQYTIREKIIYSKYKLKKTNN